MNGGAFVAYLTWNPCAVQQEPRREFTSGKRIDGVEAAREISSLPRGVIFFFFLTLLSIRFDDSCRVTISPVILGMKRFNGETIAFTVRVYRRCRRKLFVFVLSHDGVMSAINLSLKTSPVNCFSLIGGARMPYGIRNRFARSANSVCRPLRNRSGARGHFVRIPPGLRSVD